MQTKVIYRPKDTRTQIEIDKLFVPNRNVGPKTITKEVEQAYEHCAKIVRDAGLNSWKYKGDQNQKLINYLSDMILAHLNAKRDGQFSTPPRFVWEKTLVPNPKLKNYTFTW